MTGIETKALAFDARRRAKSLTNDLPTWDDVDGAAEVARRVWKGMGVYLVDGYSIRIHALDVVDLAAAMAVNHIGRTAKVHRRNAR